MMSPGRKDFSYSWNLFQHLRPQLEELLRRYEIPPSEAGTLLEETVLELIYKGERVEDPAPWLVSRARNKCRKYWVTRRRAFSVAMGKTFSVQ